MKHGVSIALGASVSLLAVSAAAQEAPAPQPSGLAEIIVTANRVESTAQKTPIALTVYSGADLAAKGIANVQALASIDPSVNVTSSTGAAYVAVRGIASTDVTEIGDPSVPIARDGFYTNRSFNIAGSMYDVARVEVLKGPQGTLNGRNSTGGLVSIITNRPTAKTGGAVSLGAGNYGAFDSEAMANLAISDTFQIRASGAYHYHQGYRQLTGLYNGQSLRGDDSDVASGRFQAAWQPVEGLKLWASYQHDSVSGVGDVALTSTLNTRPTFSNAQIFSNVAPTSTSVRSDRVRWEASYDRLPAGLTLIYAGGYDKSQWNHRLDSSGPAYPAVRQFVQSESPATWNHEVRLSNNVGNRLFFQAGWFHFQEANIVNSAVLNLAMTGAYAPGGTSAFLSQAGVAGIKFNYNILTKSDGVFAQAAYRVTDQVKVSLGLRNTWDSKVRTGGAVLNYPALAFPEWGFVFPFTTSTTPGNGNVSKSQPTYHIGVDYQVTPRSLIYAKFDTGYKSGGFNSNGSSASVPYDAEKLSAWEIGTKNRFLDNRLQLNAAAFYFDYRGYQASQTQPALGGAGVFNVGSATIYGAEVQGTALLGTGFKLDLNAAYLHTKFGTDAQGKPITVTDGGGVDHVITGNRLPNAPSFSATAGLEKSLEAKIGTFTPRLEGKYSSSFAYDVFNNADTRSDAYVVGNVSVNFKPAHGAWQIDAYVRNVGDKTVLANAARNYVGGLNTYQFQPPRTFGLRGSVKF